MNLKQTTYMTKVALAVSLLSAIQIPSAFANNYHLRGATCANGGTPNVTLMNDGNGFVLELATGGGSSRAGLVVKGLESDPILVKDLDTKQLTAVFTPRDKDVFKYDGNIRFKVNFKNDIGKVYTATIATETDMNEALTRGRIFLKRNGNKYEATLPTKIFIDIGNEVPKLNLSGNSQIVYCVIYLDGEAIPRGKPKEMIVNSVSVSGKQLPIKLENILGCDAFPNIGFVQ